MNTEPEETLHGMKFAIRDSWSDLVSSDDGEDEEDNDDDPTEQGKLSEDDEPGWVMGTISTMVLQCMERFRQKQMKFEVLTILGWEDVADNFRERDQQ